MSDHDHFQGRQTPTTPRTASLGQWENEGGGLPSQRSPATSPQATDPDASSAHAGLLQALPVAILITDRNGTIRDSNPACHDLYGASAADLLGQPWHHYLNPADVPVDRQQPMEAADQGQPVAFETRLLSASGKLLWARYGIASLGSANGSHRHIHTIEDITELKASRQATASSSQALSAERERARVTLESIGDGVISTDSDGRVSYMNAVAEELTGWTRDAARGRAFGEVFSIADSESGETARNPAVQTMERGKIIQMAPNCLLRRRDGSELAIEDSAAPILDVDEQMVGAVVVFRDRKMSRETTERMAHMARHDVLTGLPNRLAFAEHFSQAIGMARRHQHRVGLLFIDLDNFKRINDSLGHEVGDQLLAQLAGLLAGCVRSTDMVSRHGGDEFVVLLSTLDKPEDAYRVVEKMQAAATRFANVHGHSISLTFTTGISLYPDDGDDMATLMERADRAMYQAKLSSKGGHAFFHPETTQP